MTGLTYLKIYSSLKDFKQVTQKGRGCLLL
jgi:hypothetical protein